MQRTCRSSTAPRGRRAGRYPTLVSFGLLVATGWVLSQGAVPAGAVVQRTGVRLATAAPRILGVSWSNASGVLEVYVRARRARSVRVVLEGAQEIRMRNGCRWGKSHWARAPRFVHEHGNRWVATVRSRHFGSVLASPLVKWHITARNRGRTSRKILYETAFPCSG